MNMDCWSDGLGSKYTVRNSDTAELEYDVFVLFPHQDRDALVAMKAYAATLPNSTYRDNLMRKIAEIEIYWNDIDGEESKWEVISEK